MLLAVIVTVAMFLIAHIFADYLSKFVNFGSESGMAKIKFSSLVSDIRGRVGEVVYSVWKTGVNYVRSTAKSIQNPQSPEQAHVRARLTECAKYWYDTLTQPQRDTWNTYASTLPKYTTGPGDIIKKSAGIMSGYNAFLRNNLNAYTSSILALGAFIADAPIGITPPDPLASFAVVWDGVGNHFDISFTGGTVPGTNVRVWVRSLDVPVHAQVGDTPTVIAGVTTIADVYTKLGRTIPVDSMPGVYEFQADVVDSNGQDSPASQMVRNVVVS